MTLKFTLLLSRILIICSVNIYMKSEVVQAVFQDELERNQRLVARYEKELESLPKGSIYKRK